MCYTYVDHFNADVLQNKEWQTVNWKFRFSWLLYHFKWQIVTSVVKLSSLSSVPRSAWEVPLLGLLDPDDNGNMELWERFRSTHSTSLSQTRSLESSAILLTGVRASNFPRGMWLGCMAQYGNWTEK